MKQRLSVFAFGLGVLATTLLAGVPAEACEASEAIVSTEWLVRHLDQPNLVIVDVRSGEEYGAGHIPNAISIPFAMPTSAWKGGYPRRAFTQRHGLSTSTRPRRRMHRSVVTTQRLAT